TTTRVTRSAARSRSSRRRSPRRAKSPGRGRRSAGRRRRTRSVRTWDGTACRPQTTTQRPTRRSHPRPGERVGAKLRIVRRRIRSVQSTKKITRAMVRQGDERLLRSVRDRGLEPVLYVIGKKGVGYFRFRGVAMEETWQGFSEVPPYEKAEEIGRRLIADFGERTIDELRCAYTDFRSAFTLRATSKRFLPIAPEEVSGGGGSVPPEYLFEPAPAQ